MSSPWFRFRISRRSGGPAKRERERDRENKIEREIEIERESTLSKPSSRDRCRKAISLHWTSSGFKPRVFPTTPYQISVAVSLRLCRIKTILCKFHWMTKKLNSLSFSAKLPQKVVLKILYQVKAHYKCMYMIREREREIETTR